MSPGSGAFLAWDVFLAVAVVLALSFLERERLPHGQRLAVAAGCLGGASRGLPLYLRPRQRQRNRAPPSPLPVSTLHA